MKNGDKRAKFRCKICGHERDHFYSFTIVKWVCEICLSTSELKGGTPLVKNKVGEKVGKTKIINSIRDRIKSEYVKHGDLDWADIAAIKIYSMYDIKPKSIKNNGKNKT